MSEPQRALDLRSKRFWGLFIVLFVVPLGLRLVPIRHGLPRNYVRDSDFPHAALVMLREKSLVPDEYLYEPQVLPYLAMPLFAGQYAWGKVAGRWDNSEEYGDHLLEHPESEQLVGRVLVALLGALTPWVVFMAARCAGYGSGAWVAAWLVATGLLHTHLSIQERAWIPFVLGVALAAWASIAHMRGGRLTSLFLCCLACTLAYATRSLPMGTVIAGICGLTWLFGPLPWRGRHLGYRAAIAAGCVLVFSVLGLLIGYPKILLAAPGETLAFELRRVALDFLVQGEFLFGERSVLDTFRLDSLWLLTRSFFFHDPLLVLLGAAGVLSALRNKALWAVLGFAALWTLSLLAHRNGHVAFLAPLTVLYAFPAAAFVEGLSPKARRIVFPLLLIPLVVNVRYQYVMTREDTRAIAEQRLHELPSEACIAIDADGPQPDLNRAALERLRELKQTRQEQLSGRQRHRLEQLESRPDMIGLDALPVEEILVCDYTASPHAGQPARSRRRRAYLDHLAGGDGKYEVWPGGSHRYWPGGQYDVLEEHRSLGTDAGSALRALGVRYLLLADYTPGLEEEHILLDETTGEPLWVIEPGIDGRLNREARLPLEMELPLISLWFTARPGPRLSLYELR